MGKLQDLLDRMLEDAQTRSKVPQKRKLPSGLHVTITAYRETYIVAIARDATYPSEKEWETVCKHFPYFIGTPIPIKYTDNDRRFAMRAEIQKHQIMQRKLL